MLKKSDVRAGDVLLCLGNLEGTSAGAWVRSEIDGATGSPYTHAAIACGSSEIADARVVQGVRIRPLDDLVAESSHVAVFRAHPGMWSEHALDELRDFTAAMNALKAGYRHRPFWKWLPMPIAERQATWDEIKSNHADRLMDELRRYFDEGPGDQESPYRRYFCSEFVVACFIHCGLIEPSAAVVFKPDVHSPGDLQKDAIFGLLVGYLGADQRLALPADDPFLNATRYHALYP